MPRVRETDLAILGTRVADQDVLCFEIDRLAFIINSPDTFGRQHLVTLVVYLV
jgi:hypothetical protein